MAEEKKDSVPLTVGGEAATGSSAYLATFPCAFCKGVIALTEFPIATPWDDARVKNALKHLEPLCPPFADPDSVRGSEVHMQMLERWRKLLREANE